MALAMGMLALAGCSRGPATVTLPSPAVLPEGTATTTHTPPVGTDTPMAPFGTTQEVPPANTYALASRRWPEAGDLIHPMDAEADFITQVEQLPSGDYFVSIESQTGTVMYVSVETSESGDLLRLGAGIDLPDGVAAEGDRVLLFRWGKTWQFYDLLGMSAWSLGEVTCVGDERAISPGGSWVAALCDRVTMPEVSDRHLVLEILSTQSGMGQQLAIPMSPRTNRNEDPHLTWLADDLLAVERVWDGDELLLCVLQPSQQSLYCPPGLPRDSRGVLGRVDTSAALHAFTDPSALPWKGWLIPADCLSAGQACTNLVDLGDLALGDRALALWGSSDPDLLWWITALDPTPLTRVGLYEAPIWQPRELVQLDGAYSIDTVCPDGHCVILVNPDNDLRYRLDLDGTLTPFPFGEIIGSFTIP